MQMIVTSDLQEFGAKEAAGRDVCALPIYNHLYNVQNLFQPVYLENMKDDNLMRSHYIHIFTQYLDAN